MPAPVCAWQIIALDALHTREVRNTHKLLVSHINAIRAGFPMLRATCVLCLESNLAFESQHLLHHLAESGVKRWLSLAEGAHGALGFLSTHATKEQGTLLLREALRMGRISFGREFLSTAMTAREARDRIVDELRSFSIIRQPPSTPFGKTKITYTGKINGKQDDLCIALQLCLLASRTFFQSSKYAAWAQS